jgi:hypothetical protein
MWGRYAVSHVAPLENIILIRNQPVVITSEGCVLSGEESNTNFSVFGLLFDPTKAQTHNLQHLRWTHLPLHNWCGLHRYISIFMNEATMPPTFFFMCWMLCCKAANDIFIVYGFTQLKIKTHDLTCARQACWPIHHRCDNTHKERDFTSTHKTL